MKRWTKDDDALLCGLRDAGEPLGAIVERFPQRSPDSVARRIRRLLASGRITRRRDATPRVLWTRREDAIIRKMRHEDDATAEEIAGHLWQTLRRKRTVVAVDHRAHVLLRAGELERKGRVSLREWTRAEDRKLERMRGKKTLAQIARALKRSVAAVQSRISVRIRKGELRSLATNAQATLSAQRRRAPSRSRR